MRHNSKDITWIRPQKGWKFVDVKEIVQYKDLLVLLSLRSIKARYAQSILGGGWAIVQPLMTTLVFTLVFGRFARVSSDGTPYFLFSIVAMVPWTYFSGTLTESANSLITNTSLISKVYFPRLILPLSAAISKLLDFSIAFIVMIVLLIFNHRIPGLSIIIFPFLLVVLLMTSLGLGMILSAMAVQYRDVKYALTFMVQLLLYAAPVVYPTSNVPEKFRYIYALNPMVGVIESFRSIFLHTQPIPLNMLLEGTVVALFLFIFGSFYFRKMERIFSDVA